MVIPSISSSFAAPQCTYSTSFVGKLVLHLEKSVFSRLENGIGISLANVGRVVVYSSLYLASFFEEAKTKQSLALLKAFLVEIITAAFFHPLTKIQAHLISRLNTRSPSENTPFIGEVQAVVSTERELVFPGGLPVEIWVQIFKRLPPSALVQCLRVNFGFRMLAFEVIRLPFAKPNEILPWEIAGKRWGGDSTELIGYICDKPYSGTLILWVKVVTFLAHAHYPLGKAERASIVFQFKISLKDDENIPQVAFEALKQMQTLGFPMHDPRWGQLCDEMVEMIEIRHATQSLEFKRDVVCFLGGQNWTFQRQKKEGRVSFFESYFLDQSNEMLNHLLDINLHIDNGDYLLSFDESLKLLHALGKIFALSDEKIPHVSLVVIYILKVIKMSTEEMTASTLLHVFSSLKKMGEYYCTSVESLMEWAIENRDDFTTDQIIKLLSFDFKINNKKKVLTAFSGRY